MHTFSTTEVLLGRGTKKQISWESKDSGGGIEGATLKFPPYMDPIRMHLLPSRMVVYSALRSHLYPHQDRFEEWRRRLEKRDISRAKLWEKRLGSKENERLSVYICVYQTPFVLTPILLNYIGGRLVFWWAHHKTLEVQPATISMGWETPSFTIV